MEGFFPHGGDAMRKWILPAIMLILAAPAIAQPTKTELPSHFGVPAETEFYPQGSPKNLLASIAKSFERGRIDYLLAHLVDPGYTDQTFGKLYHGKFGKYPEDDRTLPPAERAARVKEALSDFVYVVTSERTTEPKKALRLDRLLKEGTVEEAGTTAKVTLKDDPSAILTLVQIEGRWFMSNAKSDRPK
jgi:hypothetical protein